MHKNRSRIPPLTPIRSSTYQRRLPGSLPRWTTLVPQTPSTVSTNEQIDELDETPPVVVVKRRRQRRPKTPSRTNQPIPHVTIQPPTPFLEPPVPAQSVQPNTALLLPNRPVKFKKWIQPREGSPLGEKAERDRKKAERIEAKRRKAVERFLCVEIVVQKDKTMPSEPVTSENRAVPGETKKRKRETEDPDYVPRNQPFKDPQNVPVSPPKKKKKKGKAQTGDASIPREGSAKQATRSRKKKVVPNNSTPAKPAIQTQRKRNRSKAKRASLVTTDNFISSSPSLGLTRSSSPLETNDGAIPSSDDTLVPDSDECPWAKPEILEAASTRLLALQKDPEVAESMQAFFNRPIEECSDFFTAITMEDWAIPISIKSQFDTIAKQLFRDVSDEMLFKDRAMNDFRFFLHLMKNRKEVGISRNFAKNLIKLTKMRSAWGRSIDEARRDIVTRVKASINNNDPLSVLVESLYGKTTNKSHANIAVVLRHVLRRKGRDSKFFDNVDKKLLWIRASPKPTRQYHHLMDVDAVKLNEPLKVKA